MFAESYSVCLFCLKLFISFWKRLLEKRRSVLYYSITTKTIFSLSLFFFIYLQPELWRFLLVDFELNLEKKYMVKA